jgi:hypothetical protein
MKTVPDTPEGLKYKKELSAWTFAATQARDEMQGEKQTFGKHVTEEAIAGGLWGFGFAAIPPIGGATGKIVMATKAGQKAQFAVNKAYTYLWQTHPRLMNAGRKGFSNDLVREGERQFKARFGVDPTAADKAIIKKASRDIAKAISKDAQKHAAHKAYWESGKKPEPTKPAEPAPKAPKAGPDVKTPSKPPVTKPAPKKPVSPKVVKTPPVKPAQGKPGTLSSKVAPAKLSDKEFPEIYRKVAEATSAAEKNKLSSMTPKEQKLWDSGKNWEAFSRKQGYSKQEIEDYRYWLELNKDPRAESARGFKDLITDPEPAMGTTLSTKPIVSRGMKFYPVEVPTESFKVDPKRFQFKLGAKLTGGVSDQFKDVDVFDPIKGLEVLGWQDKSGDIWIVDGHHRLGIAKKTKHPALRSFILREADGVTAEMARAIGALNNLSAGKGTAVDAAKLFRDTDLTLEELKKQGVPTTGAIIRQGMGMKDLSDHVFRLVVNDRLPANFAAVIGENVQGDDLQKQVADLILEGEVDTVRQAELLAKTITSAPVLTEKEQTLFGFETSEKSLYAERAKILANVEQTLKRNKKVFATLSEQSGLIEGKGNILAKDVNLAEKERAAEVLFLLEKFANAKGPVAEALNEATKEYAKNPTKANLSKVTKELVSTWMESTSGLSIQNKQGIFGTPAKRAEQPVKKPDAGKRQADLIDKHGQADVEQAQSDLADTSDSYSALEDAFNELEDAGKGNTPEAQKIENEIFDAVEEKLRAPSPDKPAIKDGKNPSAYEVGEIVEDMYSGTTYKVGKTSTGITKMEVIKVGNETTATGKPFSKEHMDKFFAPGTIKPWNAENNARFIPGKETITAAIIKVGDQVFEGSTHDQAVKKAIAANVVKFGEKGILEVTKQGDKIDSNAMFITSKGRTVNRIEAGKISGQMFAEAIATIPGGGKDLTAAERAAQLGKPAAEGKAVITSDEALNTWANEQSVSRRKTWEKNLREALEWVKKNPWKPAGEYGKDFHTIHDLASFGIIADRIKEDGQLVYATFETKPRKGLRPGIHELQAKPTISELQAKIDAKEGKGIKEKGTINKSFVHTERNADKIDPDPANNYDNYTGTIDGKTVSFSSDKKMDDPDAHWFLDDKVFGIEVNVSLGKTWHGAIEVLRDAAKSFVPAAPKQAKKKRATRKKKLTIAEEITAVQENIEDLKARHAKENLIRPDDPKYSKDYIATIKKDLFEAEAKLKSLTSAEKYEAFAKPERDKFMGNMTAGEQWGDNPVLGNFNVKKKAAELAESENGIVHAYNDGKYKRGWVVIGKPVEKKLPPGKKVTQSFHKPGKQEELFDKGDFKTLKEQERINAQGDIAGQSTLFGKPPAKPAEKPIEEKPAKPATGEAKTSLFDHKDEKPEKVFTAEITKPHPGDITIRLKKENGQWYYAWEANTRNLKHKVDYKTADDSIEAKRKVMEEFFDWKTSLIQGGLSQTELKLLQKLSKQMREMKFGVDLKTQDLLDEPKKVEAAIKADQIKDFGEKLGGARKDYYAKLGRAKGLDIESHPLSKTFPEPDYNKLIESGKSTFIVSAVRAMRDAIPAKPRKTSNYGRQKLKQYAEQVEYMRDFAEKVLKGDISEAQFKNRLINNPGVKPLHDSIDLYELVGHDVSLKGVTLKKVHYSLYKGQKDVTKWEITRRQKQTALSNMPRRLGSGDTRQAAIDDFINNYKHIKAEDKAPKKIKFQIYSYKKDPGKIWIGKQVGKNTIDLKSFDNAKEAMEYRGGNYDQLLKDLEKAKYVPDVRRKRNEERIGKDHRGGKDITPEQFNDAFGFRGVEFGNWVTKTNERQMALNNAYDGLMDLAEILDIPAQAISLNGELGLAFGSRGRGGKNAAAAHYEPDKMAINLTRKQGAGSLAHEWFHALDNFFSRSRKYPGEFVSARAIQLGPGHEIRPEMIEAYKGIIKAYKTTGIIERSARLDKRRSKPYWTNAEELAARTFENYVIEKLADQGFSNDYLANVASVDSYAADMLESLLESESLTAEDFYPYLTDSEIKEVKKAFDKFFDTMEVTKTRKGFRPGIIDVSPLTNAAELFMKMIEPSKAVEIQHGKDVYAEVIKGTHKADVAMIEFNEKQIEGIDQSLREFGKELAKYPNRLLELLMITRGKAENPDAIALQHDALSALQEEAPELIGLRKAIGDIADFNYEYLQSVVGDEINYIEDYFYGIYKDPGKVDRFISHWKTTKRFIKDKKLPTVADAKVYGLDLRDPNPVNNLQAEYLAIARLEGMIDLKNSLLASGKGKYIAEFGDAPIDWVEVAEPVFKDVRLEPDLAYLINNLIATNKITRMPFLNAWRKVNNFLRTIKFVGSAFHMLVIAKQAMADTPVMEILRNPGKAFRGFTTGFDKGDPVFKTPEYKKYVSLGGSHRYSIDSEAQKAFTEWADSINNGIEKLLGIKHAGKALKGTAAVLRFPEGFTRWMFEDYIPKVKYAKYLDALHEKERDLGRSITDAEHIDIIKEQQNFYGMMNERLFGRSGTVTTALRFFFMAPGFAEGNFRTMLKAQLQWGQGKTFKANRSRRNILQSLILSLSAATIGTVIMTGKPPEIPETRDDIRDLFKIDTGRVDRRGNKLMLDVLTYDKDYWDVFGNIFTGQPTKAIGSTWRRLGGMTATSMEMMIDLAKMTSGEAIYDWRGNRIVEITDPFLTQVLKLSMHEIEKGEPISMNVFQQARRRDLGVMLSAITAISGTRLTKTEAARREQKVMAKIFSLREQQEQLYYYLGTVKNPLAVIKSYNATVMRILDNRITPESVREEFEPKLIIDVDRLMSNKVKTYVGDLASIYEMKDSPVRFAKQIEEKSDKIIRAERWLKNFDISEKDYKKHLVVYEMLHRKLIKELRPEDKREELKKTLANFYAELGIATRKKRTGKISKYSSESRRLKRYEKAADYISEQAGRYYNAKKQIDRKRYLNGIESRLKRLR